MVPSADLQAKHTNPGGDQTRSPCTLETFTSEVDKETAQRPHLHCHRPRTVEKVAMGDKTSRRSFLPMWGDSERGPPNEVSADRRWGRKKSRTSVER